MTLRSYRYSVLLLALAMHISTGGAGDLLAHGETKEADVDLGRLDVVTDSPWRVQVRPGGATLPVLFFFPETKDGWRRVQVRAIRIFEVTETGASLLYEDMASTPPIVMPSATSDFTGRDAVVVDPWGRVDSDLDVVREPSAQHTNFTFPEINDNTRGWHLILRLNVPQSAVEGGSGKVGLQTEVDYVRLGIDDHQIYTIRRRLYTELDTKPLPTFNGWVAYDTHVHTIAEYSSDLSYKAIRKAYGGPVQMFKEAAVAVGLIDHMGQFKDRVITTDHNTFFSDREYVRHGPTIAGISPGGTSITRPDLKDYFIDDDEGHIPEGQREFENYLDLYGMTFGQEITLAKTTKYIQWISGTLGSHLLAYSTRHFMGPFHGGSFFIYRDEENNNTLERVLNGIATDDKFLRGFCYAAHPFSPSRVVRGFLTAWTEDQIDTAIKGEFIREKDEQEHDFAFKGFELWNEKMTRRFTATINSPDHLLELKEDPTKEALWAAGNPNWDDDLQYGMWRYHQAVCDSMQYFSAGAPRIRYIRKFYIASGTDAHGDFNRDNSVVARGLAALPGLISRFWKAFSVSDNAFGKLRTLVDADPEGLENATLNEKALVSYSRGQSVISDGPVLTFSLDADHRLDSQSLAFDLRGLPHNPDGRLGGDGRLDGGRTALVATGGQDAQIAYRWNTTETFGSDIERIESTVDEAGSRVKMIKVERGGVKTQVIQPTALIEPVRDQPGRGAGTLPLIKAYGELASGRGSRPVQSLAAIALSGYTNRTLAPPYDFRCHTNPIWVAPVQLNMTGRREGDTIPAGALSLSLTFPISMKDEPVTAWIQALDGNGSASGERIPLEPQFGQEQGIFTPAPRHDVDDAVLLLSNSQDFPMDPGPESRGYVVILSAVRDAHGNRLNPIAWHLVPSPEGQTPAPLRLAPPVLD